MEPEAVVRDAVQADVAAINQLFCDEYGDGYPYLIGLLNPDHVNMVAVLDGEIVGFAKAAPYGRYDHAWELCSLMVQPDCRGMGIAREFGIARIARLRSMGAKTLVAEPVTCYENCASQRNLYHFGFYGILPFKHPWIRPVYLGDQPLSLTLAVCELNGGTGFGTRQMFLSAADRDAASLILPPGKFKPPWEHFFGVKMPRPHFMRGKEVHGITGADYVDVPVNWTASAHMVRVLRQEGYRFSAILPGFGRTQQGAPYDLLRLYRPARKNNQFTFDLVHVVPELEPLKRFCQDELAR
jgi:GNAT superfamily N-acetyltransferase